MKLKTVMFVITYIIVEVGEYCYIGTKLSFVLLLKNDENIDRM